MEIHIFEPKAPHDFPPLKPTPPFGKEIPRWKLTLYRVFLYLFIPASQVLSPLMQHSADVFHSSPVDINVENRPKIRENMSIIYLPKYGVLDFTVREVGL